MFEEGQFAESDTSTEVSITHDSVTFKYLLEYIYTNEVQDLFHRCNLQ